jgi:hypothetical protein
MGYHEGSVNMLGLHEKYRGECSCGAAGLWNPNRQEAEDFLVAHAQQVERARSHLQSRTPPLASQADYYRKQADEPGCSEADQRIWLQLADELDTRLGRKAPPFEDTALFSDQPFRKE